MLAPNFRFDAPSFLTKNGIINIVKQLGPNTKNVDRYIGGWQSALRTAWAALSRAVDGGFRGPEQGPRKAKGHGMAHSPACSASFDPLNGHGWARYQGHGLQQAAE